jgi:hypothetical protein
MKKITSTYFIKGQLPGVDLTRLLEQYRKEIMSRWVVRNVVVNSNSLEFEEELNSRGRSGYYIKNSIEIVETASAFIVYRYAESYWAYVGFAGVAFASMRNDIERELQGVR